MHRREVAPLTGGMSPELEAIQVESRWDENLESTDHDQKQLSERDRKEQYSSKKSRTILLAMEEIFDPRGPYLPMLNKIFLTSWVIAVLTDPLFLYIPNLNENKKCLKMDKNLKIIALFFRTITDISYIVHIIFQLRIGYMPKAISVLDWKSSKTELAKYALTRARTINWSNILIDILAVLPVPQVLVLDFFSKTRPGFMRSLTTKKLLLYMFLLFQYAPRVIPIYLSCEELKKIPDAFTRTLWVRGAFNLFLYIIASHVFGAFWYFFSVQQEMECWHYACKNLIGCLPNALDSCNTDNALRNLTSLNEFCPINPPNTMVFDFGIFLGALQSGVVGSTDFPKKLLQCSWWGLRNLSSFGSNLQTSSSAWEICFAALICMLGLLLFLYLIGNLQLYMQLATQRSEDRRYNRKLEIRRIMKAKEPDIYHWASTHNFQDPEKVKTLIMTHMLDTLENDKKLDFKHLQKKLHSYLPQDQLKQEDMDGLRIIHLRLDSIISKAKRQQWNNTEETAQLWMIKNAIPTHIMPMIKKYVEYRLQNNKDDVDLVNLLSVLPMELQTYIKLHLCFSTLKKVPVLKNFDEEMFEEMIKHLKPVTYAENSYVIREGEPISHMLFITYGVVWIFRNGSEECVAKKKGDYHHGEELVKWQLKTASYSYPPISTANVQAHTKVEGLALKAVDLNHVLSKYWWKLPISSEYEPKLLKRFAVNAIGEAWLRVKYRRSQKDDHLFKWKVVKRRWKGVTAWIN